MVFVRRALTGTWITFARLGLGALATLGAFGACGGSGGADGDGGATSGDATDPLACTDVAGTRLTPARLTTPDGVDVRWAWHDAGRDEDCTFTPAGDGALRCWPSRAASSVGALRYRDPLCTQPVVELTGCPSVRYVWIPTGACGASELRALGAAGDPGPLYGLDAGTCQAVEPGRTAQPYPVGDPIPWTSFVGATATTAPGARTRLDVARVTADDGTTEVCAAAGPIVDTMIDAPCAPQLAADGAIRCLPPSAPALAGYADAACSIPLVDLQPICAQPVSPHRRQASPTGCGALAVLAVEPLGATATYAGHPAECVETAIPPPAAPGVLGAELPPETFAKLAPVEPVAGRRLTPDVLTTSDGFVVFRGGFLDEDLGGVRCTPGANEGGVVRCLPAAVPIQAAYSDPSCTEPLEVVVVDACSFSAPVLGARTDGATCPATTTYHRLGAAPVEAYLGDLDRCQLAARAGQAAYAVGDALAPADLATLTVVQEIP